jgi:hypothetical protein
VRARQSTGSTSSSSSAAGCRATGELESFEICFLEPHGGDLAGFILLRGETAQMDALRDNDEFLHHMTRADLHVEGLGVVSAALGDGIARQMAIYQEEIGALA